jgi:hypothetical protein
MSTTPHTPIVVCDNVGRCTICGEPGNLVTIQDAWRSLSPGSGGASGGWESGRQDGV